VLQSPFDFLQWLRLAFSSPSWLWLAIPDRGERGRPFSLPQDTLARWHFFHGKSSSARAQITFPSITGSHPFAISSSYPCISTGHLALVLLGCLGTDISKPASRGNLWPSFCGMYINGESSQFCLDVEPPSKSKDTTSLHNPRTYALSGVSRFHFSRSLGLGDCRKGMALRSEWNFRNRCFGVNHCLR
jgi:hypothetical protein